MHGLTKLLLAQLLVLSVRKTRINYFNIIILYLANDRAITNFLTDSSKSLGIVFYHSAVKVLLFVNS